MEMTVWYCPKCDVQTGRSVGHCGKCGEKAVHQRFSCWPVENNAADDYFDHLHAPEFFDDKLKKLRKPTFAEYLKNIGNTPAQIEKKLDELKEIWSKQ